MKRRNFIGSTLAVSALSAGTSLGLKSAESENELYELRTYHIRFLASASSLITYLQEVLQVEYEKIGATHFQIFREYGMNEPQKLWVLIAYPNSSTYIKAQQLTYQEDFVAKAATYNDVRQNVPIFTKFESCLLLAIDGIKQLIKPADDTGLYEIRFYEGHNEDATRRKIEMFNVEELALFEKVGLNSIFFGDMISGPNRPCLVYMLGFKDMEERNERWSVFGNHPEWKKMLNDPKYAETVSNIIKIFLLPL